MFDMITRNWWVLALRGLFAVLFGVLALFRPEITLWAMVVVTGAYALVDGVFGLLAAVGGRGGATRWLLALAGIAGIAFGMLALLRPGLTALALLYLIAGWAVVTGVMEIIAAFGLRHEVDGSWTYALTGLVSALFGVLLFAWPVDGALAMVRVVGIVALVFGALLIGGAFRARALGRRAAERYRHQAGPGGTSAAPL
ncbi:HdeD family acid-resistance protein [Actinomadura kijaniata]|uniref:HdeD family acid-resistance protein n=1 Tax=Actinomadura kijaniata TaxID=46161 RepID=UPI003F1DE400